MSDYELICEDGLYEDLVLADKMVSKADRAFPDGWAEIRMDSGGACYAYTNTPVRRGIAWWGFDNDARYKKVGKGRLDWNWETFGIIRPPEAKPKRGKKTEQIKLLSAYAAELLRKLSATEAMLAELQREILELSKDAPIPTTFDIETIRQSWLSEGWDDGAAAMLKAAQNAEAVLIYEANGGEINMQAAMGAARVVGAVQNAHSTGMLTGEVE